MERRRRTLPGRFVGSLGVVAGAAAAPYGYTATVWGSGAVLADLRGTPTVGDAFSFLGGLVAAFATIAVLSRLGRDTADESGLREWLITGALHAIAIAVAVGGAALCGLAPPAAAWPLGGFAATVLYLSVAAVERLVADVLGRRALGPGA